MEEYMYASPSSRMKHGSSILVFLRDVSVLLRDKADTGNGTDGLLRFRFRTSFTGVKAHGDSFYVISVGKITFQALK
jgi:hypothetical protein